MVSKDVWLDVILNVVIGAIWLLGTTISAQANACRPRTEDGVALYCHHHVDPRLPLDDQMKQYHHCLCPELIRVGLPHDKECKGP
jgi:hypothetical protein